MKSIKPILDACIQFPANGSYVELNQKLLPLAWEYCKHHQYSSEIILIIKVRGFNRLLYSYGYGFSIPNLAQNVERSLNVAQRTNKADIIILEWIPSKSTMLPYSSNFAC